MYQQHVLPGLLTCLMFSSKHVVLCTAFCIVFAGAAAQSVLPSYSGYLSTNKLDGSELFYAYYEAQQAKDQASTAPTHLWLQVCT